MRVRIFNILALAFDYRSIIFGIAYGLYAVFLEDQIVRQFMPNQHEESPPVHLAYLIFVFQLAEALALQIKWRAVRSRISLEKMDLLINIAVWAFHAALSLIITFKALAWLAATHSGTLGNSKDWQTYFFIAVVLKEITLLLPIIPMEDSYAKKPISRTWEFAADVMLLAYLCLAYSLLWKADVEVGSKYRHNIIESFALSFLFLMLYVPMCFAEIVELVVEWKTRTGKIKLGIAILIPLTSMHLDRL
jgi:glucose-6-phosphate-specific signal transduction histidine kinase